MRRALPALFALVLALALAVPAMAATPSPARMAAQIRTLQGQVKTLQKTLKKTNTTLLQTEAVAVVALLYGGDAHNRPSAQHGDGERLPGAAEHL